MLSINLNYLRPYTVCKASWSVPKQRYHAESSPDLSHRVSQLNARFLRLYAKKKQAIKSLLGKAHPVLIAKGDDLILKYDGVDRVVSYIPQNYHLIKGIAHSVGTLDTLDWLSIHCPEEGETWQMERETLESELASLKQELENLLREPVKDLNLSKWIQLAEKLLEEAPLSTAQPEIASLVEDFIEEAAITRTDAMDSAVQNLQCSVLPEDWERLSMIVIGPRMPREGDLSMQYFEEMLCGVEKKNLSQACPYAKQVPRTEGRRLIYAESIKDTDEALDLLASEIADEALGLRVFKNPLAMHGDILHKATRLYLQKLKNQRRLQQNNPTE